MTPGARVAAAIEVLDAILAGSPAEQALTRWARSSRFAGSKDRAALRDHVFDAVRNLRSYAVTGGRAWPDTTGRAVMIGAMRAQGGEIDALFSGQGHAPAPLSDAERALHDAPPEITEQDAFNLPDWLVPVFRDSLGEDAGRTATALCARAPVSIRVNTRKSNVAQVQEILASDGIETQANPLADTALSVLTRPRQLVQTRAYADGLFELQDASSQAVVAALQVAQGVRTLDYCAGGGGKALALAMASGAPVRAHDIDAQRMRDIPERARRADADIRVTPDLSGFGAEFDLVLVDAPCSGSGSWRRAPDAKWRFTAERFAELQDIQASVLHAASAFVARGGCLAYATCSVLGPENDRSVARFLDAHPHWVETARQSWAVSDAGDGFFLSQLKRE